MKLQSVLLVPVLISALTSGAAADASSLAPVVKIEKQILTREPILFQPLHLKDPKTGEDLLLAQHRRRGFGAFINVALYDTKGRVLLTRRLADQENLQDYSWISHARFTGAGELIVLQTLSEASAAPGRKSSVWSHNLTLGTSVKLIDNVENVRVLERIVEPTRSLVGLMKGTNVSGSVYDSVEIIDESTGAIARSIPLKQMESARVGVGTDGLAKVLISGYEPSDWKTIDVKTGLVKSVPISEEEARNQLGDQTTVLGTHFQLISETTLSLIDRAALFDAKIVRVRAMPKETQFFGAEPQRLAMERTSTTLIVRDLKSGKQIGKSLPVNPAFPERTKDDFQMRGVGLVEDILLTPLNKIIVIHESIIPHSYMPGSVLSYMDLETGRLLRRQSLDLYTLKADLVENEQGRALAVEHDYYRVREQGSLNQVVDIRSGQVLRKIAADEKYFTVMMSASGRPIQARADDQGKMCFADLLLPEAANICVGLPLGAYTGWFDRADHLPAMTNKFRSGVIDSPERRDTDRGWVEFSVH